MGNRENILYSSIISWTIFATHHYDTNKHLHWLWLKSIKKQILQILFQFFAFENNKINEINAGWFIHATKVILKSSLKPQAKTLPGWVSKWKFRKQSNSQKNPIARSRESNFLVLFLNILLWNKHYLCAWEMKKDFDIISQESWFKNILKYKSDALHNFPYNGL